MHQVGEDGDGLAEQPGDWAEDAADQQQVGKSGRGAGKEGVDRHGRQAATCQQRREEEIASDDVQKCTSDPAAGGVAQRQRKQEQGNGRCSDGDGAANVR